MNRSAIGMLSQLKITIQFTVLYIYIFIINNFTYIIEDRSFFYNITVFRSCLTSPEVYGLNDEALVRLEGHGLGHAPVLRGLDVAQRW